MRGPITDHDEIRRWAEAHDARPVEMIPYKYDGEPATLRFIFGEVKDQPEFRRISWETFFAMFELLGLALVVHSGQVYELLLDRERMPQGLSDLGA